MEQIKNYRLLGTIWAVIAITTVFGAVLVYEDITGYPGFITRCVLGLASAIAVLWGVIAYKKIGLTKSGRIGGWVYFAIESLGVIAVIYQGIMTIKATEGASAAAGAAEHTGIAIYLLEIIIIGSLAMYAYGSPLYKTTKWTVLVTMIITYILTILPSLGVDDPLRIIPKTNSILKMFLWSVITILALIQRYRKNNIGFKA